MSSWRKSPVFMWVFLKRFINWAIKYPFQIHVSLVEFKKPNATYKKLLERSILVCQLHNQKRGRDIAYNFIKKISTVHANFTNGCPLNPGFYSLTNYKFDSTLFPAILRISDMNVTVKADYCSGKKWKPNNPSCFISALFRLRYVNWMK